MKRTTVLIAHRTSEYQEKRGSISSQDHYPLDDPNHIHNADDYYEVDEWETAPYTGVGDYNPNSIQGDEPIRSWKRKDDVWILTRSGSITLHSVPGTLGSL